MALDEQDRPPRVLVLGSDGYGRGVAAHRWDRLPGGLNVADYEMVVLDFASAVDQEVKVPLPDVAQFVRLSFSRGTIFAIGDPDTMMTGQQDARWWFPLEIDVTRESGDVVEPERGWEFWFESNVGFAWGLPPSQSVPYAWNRGQPSTSVNLVPIASTRYHLPVAVEISLRVGTEVSGVSYWLPLPTELSPYDAVSLLLREKLGLNQIATIPTWMAGYRLPAEVAADDALREAKEAVETARAAEEEARRHLDHENRFRALLYATGQELEAVVHDALRTLGATIEPPSSDKDDGRLVDPTGRNGMLEIKGVKGSVGVEHVRQLQGWALDAETTGWEGKTILVGNALRDVPPSERAETVADNAAKFAARHGTVIVTTGQIFEALRRLQHGEGGSTSEFWDALFCTNGVSDLPTVAPDID